MRRLLISLALLGGGLWWLLRLRPLSILLARRAPDYAGAEARISALRAADTSRVNPICRTQALTHGARTAKAFGLLHGFSNCPAQYEAIARELHSRGHNVAVPRIAHHGLANPLASDFARLTAEQMVATASELCDILAGLGEETILVGFSMGGAIAAWAAQNRPDVGHAVLVSPALALSAVPIWARGLAARLLILLPNRFVWWDPVLREARIGPPHAYPRYATRAVGHLLRLGHFVESAAKRQIYACGRVTVITNPQDDTVDNEGVARVVHQWRRHGGIVGTFAFPAELGLIHDFVDPNRPDQQTHLAYPALLEWIDAPV